MRQVEDRDSAVSGGETGMGETQTDHSAPKLFLKMFFLSLSLCLSAVVQFTQTEQVKSIFSVVRNVKTFPVTFTA